MLWAIAESGKLEKKKVWRNLVGARSLEGLGTLGRLGLCSCSAHILFNNKLELVICKLGV